MSGAFESKTSEQQKIDPNVNKYGNQVLDAIMMAGRLDPRQAVYQGPTVAAMNPAQMGAMDATAAASNAFGIPAQSASQSLPQAYDYGNGMIGHSGAQAAMAGMSPAMSQMLDFMYGQGGIMNPGGRGGRGGRGGIGEMPERYRNNWIVAQMLGNKARGGR